MTRAIFTWTLGAWFCACSSTTKLHIEEIELNGGAAGETSTPDDETNTGGSAAGADAADAGAGASAGRGGATGSAGDDR
jgi:hypothetical protein